MKNKISKGFRYVSVLIIGLSMIFCLQMLSSVKAYAATVYYGTPKHPNNPYGVANTNAATYYLDGMNVSGSGLSSAVITVNSGKITNKPSNTSEFSVFTDSAMTTMTFIWNTPVDGSKVTNAIKDVWYTPDRSATTNQVVEIAVSNHTNNLPDNSRINGVAAIKDTNNVMHYYMIIDPIDGGDDYHYRSWVAAYNEAKTFQFMGMKGYLCTMTNSTEKAELKNKCQADSWLGGTRLYADSNFTKFIDPQQLNVNYTSGVNLGNSYYLSTSATGKNSYYWICGPEAGNQDYLGVNGDNWHNGEPNNNTSHVSGYPEWVIETYMANNGAGDFNDYSGVVNYRKAKGTLMKFIVEFGGYGTDSSGVSLDPGLSTIEEQAKVESSGGRGNVKVDNSSNVAWDGFEAQVPAPKEELRYNGVEIVGIDAGAGYTLQAISAPEGEEGGACNH